MQKSEDIKQSCIFIATSWGNGAVPQHFLALSSELAKRGHRVVLIVDGQVKDVERPEGNPAIYTWPSKRPNRFSDFQFFFRLVRRQKPDCIIANFGAVNLMMTIGLLLGISYRIAWYRTLSSQIDQDFKIHPLLSLLFKTRKKWVYNKATHVIANSQAAMKDAHQIYRIPETKIKIFPNSLIDPLKTLNVDPSKKEQNTIVCAGRFNPSKGQDVLIKSLPIVKQSVSSVRVQFIGNGPTKDALITLAQDLGVEQQCEFLGSLPHERVILEMAMASVTVIPSRNEAFGKVSVESLAVGTPVIASAVGGLAEIIRDNIDGLLISPNDAEDLASKLIHILSDSQLRYEMGKNGRKCFLNHFEQEASIKNQINWLEEVLSSRG
jgi:glycosyltransferase involved in cell wall biosynthesis